VVCVLSSEPVAKAFAFCDYFSFLNCQIKRFGGLCKHAQAFKYRAFCPICYEPLLATVHLAFKLQFFQFIILLKSA
jgi:hypothetical protein